MGMQRIFSRMKEKSHQTAAQQVMDALGGYVPPVPVTIKAPVHSKPRPSDAIFTNKTRPFSEKLVRVVYEKPATPLEELKNFDASKVLVEKKKMKPVVQPSVRRFKSKQPVT